MQDEEGVPLVWPVGLVWCDLNGSSVSMIGDDCARPSGACAAPGGALFLCPHPPNSVCGNRGSKQGAALSGSVGSTAGSRVGGERRRQNEFTMRSFSVRAAFAGSKLPTLLRSQARREGHRSTDVQSVKGDRPVCLGAEAESVQKRRGACTSLPITATSARYLCKI